MITTHLSTTIAQFGVLLIKVASLCFLIRKLTVEEMKCLVDPYLGETRKTTFLPHAHCFLYVNVSL